KVADFRNLLSERQLPSKDELEVRREINTQQAAAESARRQLRDMKSMYNLTGRLGEFSALAPNFATSIPRSSDNWRILSGDNRAELMKRTVRQSEPLLRIGCVDGPWRVELRMPQRSIGHIAKALATRGEHRI